MNLNRLLVIFINSILLFSTITDCRNSSNRDAEKHKVVIVGAGIAGLGAATNLLQNNVTDILVLEASNRLGGRVYTANFGDYVIEYGAQWIHGECDNVVYDLVKQYNVTLLQNFDQPNFMKSPKSKINVTLAKELFDEAFDLFYDDDEMTECNCSMLNYFEKRYANLIESKNIIDTPTTQAIKEIVIKFQGAYDGTGDLNNEGAWGNTQYSELNGSLAVAWKSGYHTLINILLGIHGDTHSEQNSYVLDKTKFNKVVQKIDWSGNEALITCEDGSHYLADHVIVTVSLGVLKFNAKDLFTPQLPNRKMSAIETLGFDVVNKVFIQFFTHWWPMDFDFNVAFLWSDEDRNHFKNASKHSAWVTDINYIHSVVQQPRILEGWLIGDAARTFEKLSNEEVMEGVMEVLHYFMGNEFNISTPINITRSSWFSNPFVRGSYSFRSLDSDYLHYFAEDIAEPILKNNTIPVILFAGEATHDHFYSTVHGALETGWRESMRIVNFTHSHGTKE